MFKFRIIIISKLGFLSYIPEHIIFNFVLAYYILVCRHVLLLAKINSYNFNTFYTKFNIKEWNGKYFASCWRPQKDDKYAIPQL